MFVLKGLLAIFRTKFIACSEDVKFDFVPAHIGEVDQFVPASHFDKTFRFDFDETFDTVNVVVIVAVVVCRVHCSLHVNIEVKISKFFQL